MNGWKRLVAIFFGGLFASGLMKLFSPGTNRTISLLTMAISGLALYLIKRWSSR